MLNTRVTDPKGGINYNQFDRVRVETIWKQSTHKTSKRAQDAQALFGTPCFQMNMANRCNAGGVLRQKFGHNRIDTVTEKCQTQSPAARSSAVGMDPKSFEVAVVRHADLGPTEKWDMPATTSHEYGWLVNNPARARSLRKLNKTISTDNFPGLLAARAVTPCNNSVLERNKSTPTLERGPEKAELKQINNRQWRRPNRTCAECQYGDAYAMMMHHNPFSKTARTRGADPS